MTAVNFMAFLIPLDGAAPSAEHATMPICRVTTAHSRRR